MFHVIHIGAVPHGCLSPSLTLSVLVVLGGAGWCWEGGFALQEIVGIVNFLIAFLIVVVVVVN